MDLLSSDALVNNAISFNIDDYALNSNIYVVELPGTTGELSLEKMVKQTVRHLMA